MSAKIVDQLFKIGGGGKIMGSHVPSRLKLLVSTIRAPFQRRGALLPPRHLIDLVGGGDFTVIGDEFIEYIMTLGGVKPHHRVLDVGSGCGRMAVPLMSRISDEGGYWGFDILDEGVRWCERNITTKHPNFHFFVSDIYNKIYNPKGKYRAQEFRFPYENDFFDFVFLTSVFTHMIPPDMNHYLSEITRVLKPGARCLITFYLLNTESRNHMKRGKSTFHFSYKLNNCWAVREDIPEAAIAFDEDYIRGCFKTQGLGIIEPIHFGSWSGREEFLSSQDIVIASKP